MSRRAFLTGGTKGIGKAVAERLLLEGWDVTATFSGDAETASKTFDDFNAFAAGRFHLLKADISDFNSIELINEHLKTNSLFLDAVIFNAGLTDRADFREIERDKWLKVFNANLHFPVFLLQTIYDNINENASVTFTGSLMAIHPHSVSLSYGVSKAAIHSLIKNLVKFLTDKKIRVNGVAPGFVDTEWQKNKPAEIRNSINNKMAAGRFCLPEEITDVYMLLINNQYMNGEIVVCDGGYSYK